MAQSRLFMRQIRELLRLHFDEGLSQRLIARSLGVVRSTVERVIKRFLACGLTWPLDPALSDADLEQRLYRGAAHVGSAKGCARPNYAEVVKQQVDKMVAWRAEVACLRWYRGLRSRSAEPHAADGANSSM